MTDLTEIVYLDCNRQNSVKSESNTNEWEYRIGEEGLVLPQGTQVSIQNSLINKKGLTGNSIVIDEDIDEILCINYYKTDNENFAPIGAKKSNPNDDAQYESLYDDYTAPAISHNLVRRDTAKLDIAELYRGHGNYLPPETNGNQNSKDIGKSEAPLSAIHLTVGENFADTQPTGITRWTDYFIEPLTKEIGIFIPKGVYGVSQMAKLIEDQIDGKLVYNKVKQNDFSTDYIEEKLLNLTANSPKTTNFDNNTTYIQKLAIDTHDGVNADLDWTRPWLGTYQKHNTMITCQPSDALNPDFTKIYFATKSFQTGVSGDGTANDPYVLATTNLPSTGVILFPETMERVFYGGWVITTASPTGTGQPVEFGGVIRFDNCIRGYEGSPYIQGLMISGTYGQIDRRAFNENERGTDSQNPDFDPPLRVFPNGEKEGAGLFTIPKYVNDMRKVYITAPATTSADGIPTALDKYNSRKKYLYSMNVDIVEYNPRPAPNPFTPARPSGVGIPTLNHGDNYYFVEDPVPIEGLQTQPRVGLISNTEFDYNPLRNGYYLGTPDFRLNWSPETSSFNMNNLHQPWRIPAYDNYGNQIEGAGQEAVMIKRANENSKNEFFTDNTPNPNYIHPAFQRSFQNTVSRYGGIGVYNWARNIARKFGDIDWTNPKVFNQDKLHLLTFNDYFTTTSKAKTAWNSSIWARLGFTYGQMCNEDAYELNQYYDRPILGDLPSDNPRLWGTTTRVDLGVGASPGVATSYNPTEVLVEGERNHIAPRTYNNMDINTPWNVAGTAIPYKSSGGNTEDYGGDINNIYSYFSSMWREMTATIVLTKGRPLTALNLPTLNEQGYYIITSDILEAHEDSLKNSKGMGLLGVVPFSQQATNDFMSNTEPLIHILNQKKILNSVKFKVLYPNLQNPEIDPNSSIILKIVRPVQAQRKTDPNEQSNPDHKGKKT